MYLDAGHASKTPWTRNACPDNFAPSHGWVPPTNAAGRPPLAAMKPFRPLITVAGLVAAFTAFAVEPPADLAKGVAGQPGGGELQPLQGTWEGVMVGDKANAKILITIKGDSFHFHRDTNFWFETTIVLPAGTSPRQLHATIKDCPPSQGSSVGKVVLAIFKIEDGTLTLASGGPDEAEEL